MPPISGINSLKLDENHTREKVLQTKISLQLLKTINNEY